MGKTLSVGQYENHHFITLSYRVSIKGGPKVFAFYTQKKGLNNITSHTFSFVILGHLIIRGRQLLNQNALSFVCGPFKVEAIFKFYYIENPKFFNKSYDNKCNLAINNTEFINVETHQAQVSPNNINLFQTQVN